MHFWYLEVDYKIHFISKKVIKHTATIIENFIDSSTVCGGKNWVSVVIIRNME
jgi:hypothetical protein